MLLKRIEARTLPDALQRVAAECGADALVVETRPTAGGYLVVAARKEAPLPPVDQAGRSARPAAPRWTRAFAPLAQRAQSFGLSPRLCAAVENALLGTRVELGRPGDPALPGLCVRVLQALIRADARLPARAVALVGPTGVGKTTTLAKLAARAVQAGEDVAILTIDTYRVAAVEQLRAFADLLAVPIEVAFTPHDLRRLLQQHERRDRVFVDTTGRSPLDQASLQALAGALPQRECARLLCLPAGARRCDVELVLDAHDRVGIDAVCLTKWDETLVPGETLSAVVERGLLLCCLGTGQDVPQDLVAADAHALARAAFDLEAVAA
jgi:flagellar biosynthesis GTPase FlhF